MWSYGLSGVGSLRSTSSISRCVTKALCFKGNTFGITGGIELAISLRRSSTSAAEVESARVS